MRSSWFEFKRQMASAPDRSAAVEASCFLLSGPEDYFKPQALQLLFEDFARRGEVERESVDPRTLEAEALIGRGQTGSLFSAGRFLVVAHAQEIKKAEQKLLAESLERLSRATWVIFATSEGEKVEAALASAIARAGLVLDFPALKTGEAAAWVAQEVKSKGKKIEPAAVKKLVERAGTGLLRLSSELEKQFLYADEEETITSAHIEALVARTAAEKIFALTDAVAERRARESLVLLARLLEERESPERIAGLLHRQFRMLWQAKLLLEMGWKPGRKVPEEAQALLPDGGAGREFSDSGRAWLARKYAIQAARLKWSQLEEALRKLQAWDLSVKAIEGKVRDGRLALELLLLELCRGLEMPVWKG